VARYYPTEDSKLNVSRGLVQDAEVRNIFGYQTAGDTTLRALWEFAATNYVFPTSAITMTVTSASASDDGKSLLIKGLDANYLEITDTVTITGGGDVNTNIPFFRINDIILLTGTTNVGLITVQNTGKTVKYGGIRAGDGRNQASIFTVPADHCYFLYRIDAFSSDSSSAKPAVFRNFTINASGQQYNTARTTFFNVMNIQRRFPFKYDQKTDIQLQCATNQGTHELAIFAEGMLIREPLAEPSVY
jgi:hypothetical protein